MSYDIEEILEQLRAPEAESEVEVEEAPVEGELPESDEQGEQGDAEETAAEAPAWDPEEKIRELASSLDRDQKLADELWKSGVHEARLLATCVADLSKQTVKSLTKLAKETDSSDLVEQLCQNVIAETEVALDLVEALIDSKEGYQKAIAFGTIASVVLREPDQPSDLMESWLEKIAAGAEDEREEVRHAVLWALLEIGKVDEYWQDAAIVLACELQAEGPIPAELGHEAEEQLSKLTNVGDRRRLVSGNSKSAKNQNNQSQNAKRRSGGKNQNRRGRGQQKQSSDASGAKKPARRNGRNKRRSRSSAPKTV